MRNERLPKNTSHFYEVSSRENSSSPRSALRARAGYNSKNSIESLESDFGYSSLARRKKYGAQKSPDSFFKETGIKLNQSSQQSFRTTDAEYYTRMVEKGIAMNQTSPKGNILRQANRFATTPSKTDNINSLRDTSSRSNSRDRNAGLLKTAHELTQAYRANTAGEDPVYRSTETDQYASIQRHLKKDPSDNVNANNLSQSKIEEVFEKLKREKEEFYQVLKEQSKRVAEIDIQNNPYLNQDNDASSINAEEDGLLEKLQSLKKHNLALKTEFDELVQKQRQFLNSSPTGGSQEQMKKWPSNATSNEPKAIKGTPGRDKRAASNATPVKLASPRAEVKNERSFEEEMEKNRLRNELITVRNSLVEMEKEMITMRMELNEAKDNLFKVSIDKEKQEIVLAQTLEEAATEKEKFDTHVAGLVDNMKDLHTIFYHKALEVNQVQRKLGRSRNEEKVQVLEEQRKTQQETNKNLANIFISDFFKLFVNIASSK